MNKQSKDKFKPLRSNPALRETLKADKFKDKSDFKKAQKRDKNTKRKK